MQSQNKFFDDLAKVVNGAAGTFAGMGREAEAGFKERLRDLVWTEDMVTREEFEAVKAMAVKAREENEQLKARLDAMDAVSTKPSATKSSPRK
ncbi:accessory factor UbiK family protein [Sphingomicrobium sp. XHP0239]|uniref:accessory factor UbiK family protein n=1 Tax=Sphingomicrobium maritimum TaxID=3133972 RepID=UPI0031CC6539